MRIQVGFTPHTDNSGIDDSRALTVVYYLNEHWREEDGGQLVLYPEGKAEVVDDDADNGERTRVEIEPCADRMVLFWSKTVPHQVISQTAKTSVYVPILLSIIQLMRSVYSHAHFVDMYKFMHVSIYVHLGASNERRSTQETGHVLLDAERHHPKLQRISECIRRGVTYVILACVYAHAF